MNPALLLLSSVLAAPPASVTEVRLPPGFTASRYADHTLANDIYTMTLDDAGRVLVAGRGYVRVLVDNDGDGRADRAIDLIDNLKGGPMGLLAEGDSLYVVADGGLLRYRGYTGTGKLTGPPEVVFAVRADGEHAAHAVRRGPDDWLYLLCGNNSGIKKESLTGPRSPVKNLIAGCLLRISPDGQTVEAVADGFRNAYSFDFHPDGEPFTYDSDNERCVGLPWYEPCRFYHVVPGGNSGWRSPQLSQTWRKPPYFADVVPPVCTTGRGSPTGVACYQHGQFPQHYRGGFFLADWTFGRVHFVPLERKGSTYIGKPEVFLEAVGESGFAPTALAVHPKTGELFVSIGGRGTRGGVYRIRADKGNPDPRPIPVAKQSREWNADAAKHWRTDTESADPLTRRHALEQLLRWHDKVEKGSWLGDAARANLSHADPLVRAAAGRLADAIELPTAKQANSLARLTLAVFAADRLPDEALRDGLAVLADPHAKPDLKLIAARVVQLACGDLTAPNAMGTVWEGYTFRRPIAPETATRILQAVRPHIDRVPHSLPELDREITRLAACVGPASDDRDMAPAAAAIGARLLHVNSTVQDDIHHLIVLGRLKPLARRDENAAIAAALLDLDRKAVKQHVARDTNWSLRFDELTAALLADNPDLSEKLLQRGELGRPEHLSIVKHLKTDAATKARIFLKAAKVTPDYRWTPGIVALLAALPAEETRPVLLQLWEQGGLEDAVLLVLAQALNADDRAKFVAGLRSFAPAVLKACADALAKLPVGDTPADVAAAIIALRKQPNDKAAAPVREALTALLTQRTGQTFGPNPKAWTAWFGTAHPEQAAKLAGTDGFDPIVWKKRETAIPWTEGDAKRGRIVFARAACAACHDGGGAVGPSLVGVAKRFGREDLLTAILQPSKDVSPRYRPERVTTTDGKVFVGMIVYEATSGVILQTGADTSVRIAGDQIESRRVLDTSFMPAGLLDKLTDQDVADLLAHLRSI